MAKLRLDELVVRRGFCETRSQAKAVILAGKIRLGTERLDKPGRSIPEDAPIEMESPPRFVSRGGEKLQGFLEAHGLAPAGLRVLDVGASTGGFTDCCLQAGASEVVCLDVGRAQLHDRILRDPRITNLERINARHLTPGDLPHDDYDWIVIDVSFISLKLILPAVWPFLREGGKLIALVKPQFEAEREEVAAGKGIIRDPEIHRRVTVGIAAFAAENLPSAREIGQIPSPITGTDGNCEFLIGWSRTPETR